MKRTLMVLALSLLSLPAVAAKYQVGDQVADMTFQDANDRTIHLMDASMKNNVRVLLFNAGWCPPCNEEFDELVPMVAQFNGRPVTFISVSAEGWSRGDDPDAAFLQEWKSQHHIPFLVTGSSGNFGQDFSDEGAIPNTAIIDQQGRFAWGGVATGAEAIISEVKSLLSH